MRTTPKSGTTVSMDSAVMASSAPRTAEIGYTKSGATRDLAGDWRAVRRADASSFLSSSWGAPKAISHVKASGRMVVRWVLPSQALNAIAHGKSLKCGGSAAVRRMAGEHVG